MSFIYYFISKINTFLKYYTHRRQKKVFETIFKNSSCSVGYNLKYYHPERIHLGNNLFIGDNVLMNSGKGGSISIGDKTSIAEGVKILSWVKEMDEKNSEIRVIKKDVVIGKYCRIGYNVIIMPGVTIGESAKVSPSSVVYSDVPAKSVAMGNPAQIIR